MKVKDNKTQKKILIFDINPSDDDITKELILGKVLQVIKKCSLNQHVVFLSHSALFLLKKMVSDMGIKQGYIISDCGARIYEIGSNKIIYQEALDLYDSLSIIHSSLVNDNLILASSDTQEVIYSSNPLYRDSLGKRHYIKLRHMDSFVVFKDFINANNIYSIMIWNNDWERMINIYVKFFNVVQFWNFEMQRGIATYFVATKKGINKSNGVRSLMNHLKISNYDNICYFGLNTYDKSILSSFRNKYVYQDVVLSSELREKDYSLGLDIDSLVHYIKRNAVSE